MVQVVLRQLRSLPQSVESDVIVQWLDGRLAVEGEGVGVVVHDGVKVVGYVIGGAGGFVDESKVVNEF